MKKNETGLQTLNGGDLASLAADEGDRPEADEVVVNDDGRVMGQEVSETNLRFPQLLMTQGQSGLVTDGDAQSGEFWDSLMREKLWPEDGRHLLDDKPDGALAEWVVGERDGKHLLPLIVVPTMIYEDRVMYGEDTVLCRSQRGGLRAAPGFQSPAAAGMGDGTDCEECPMSDWTGGGPDRQPPKCSERMNVYCVMPFLPDAPQIVIPFTKTSLGAGQTIATKTSMMKVNPWHLMWGIYCTLEKFAQGSAYVFRVKHLRYTPKEIRAAISEEARRLKDILKAEEVHADADAGAASNGTGNDDASDTPEPVDADYEEEDEEEDPFGDN